MCSPPARAGRGGPWVAPGIYQVRLIVGDWSATRPVRVLPDPRLTKEGLTPLDYRAQLTTALAARDLVSAVKVCQEVSASVFQLHVRC